MTGNLRYILDANVFIEACKRYYAFDICPGFWESINHHGERGVLGSIDRVRDELQEGATLDEWKTHAAPLFLPTDTPAIVAEYTTVIRWAQEQTRFTLGAKAAFADNTDAWLIAAAKAHGLTMITHEQPAPKSEKSVKIPDVCKAFGINYRNTFDMLRDLQVSYGWSPPA